MRTDDLDRALDQLAASQPPVADGWPSVQHRIATARRRRIVTVLAVPVLVGALAIWHPWIVAREPSDLAVTGPSSDATGPPTTIAPSRTITGALLNGRIWTVRDDPSHGLCVTFDQTNIGCDDVGPVLPAGANPATARLAADSRDTGNLSEDRAAELAYGFLPAGATQVKLSSPDKGFVDTAVAIDQVAGIWAMPLQPGRQYSAVTYLGPDNQVVAQLPIR